MFTDLKTSITGVLTGIVGILGFFNIIDNHIATIIITIGSSMIGIFASDAKK
jgi:hypothetical protein